MPGAARRAAGGSDSGCAKRHPKRQGPMGMSEIILIVCSIIVIASGAYLALMWALGIRPIFRVIIMKGKCGLGSQPCPRCGSALPRLHIPKPFKQGGGFPCKNCGCEVDRLGHQISNRARLRRRQAGSSGGPESGPPKKNPPAAFLLGRTAPAKMRPAEPGILPEEL